MAFRMHGRRNFGIILQPATWCCLHAGSRRGWPGKPHGPPEHGEGKLGQGLSVILGVFWDVRSLIVQPEQRRADFLKLCDAITVKQLVTRYTTHKNTAAEYICGCVLCSVAHCCVDWIWRDNISPNLTWVILSAITLAVCLADMSASPLWSYPA